ncbi:HdeD family acid-resistance protein [Legionella nagasakiensis]|uniref:HdeD family acid-resistance protein n=1 Tax=Legionella nagasakiensis TaxID=535290 RepID=UPI001056B343|nr:HdeD family acid-resistance protein [Legionella nagasakiensis]
MQNMEINLEQLPASLRRNWGWLLGLGILFVILGCIGLGMVVGLTLVSMLFLGVLLIIGGFSQIIDVFKSKHWKGSAWHALIAVLYLMGGGIIIYDPFLASTVITALLAAVLIVMGVIRFIMAITLRDSKGWGWLLLSGLTAGILGLLIFMQWPWSGLWIIGLFITVEMLVSGWTYIFLALAIRRA